MSLLRSDARRLRSRRAVATAAVLALMATAAGCGDSDSGSEPAATDPAVSTQPAASTEPAAPATEPEAGAWPRTVTHELGTTEIPAQPERVVSTTITATGTLLAIGAPLVASAATSVGWGGADDRGFFTQWSDVATERGVEVLYPDLEFDLEAVIAAEPDLIVVSTSGADTVADHYDQLADVAPTVVVNYSDKSWQELAVVLGEVTGLEQQAADVVAEFDEYVAAAAASVTVPDPNTVSIISFNGAEYDTAVAKLTSAHAAILEPLGFEVVPADDALDTSEQDRQDFAFVSMENVTKAVTGEHVLMISATDDDVPLFAEDPTLANLTAITEGQVFALGLESFRIDNYSGRMLVDRLVELFG